MLEDIRLAFQGIWNHKLRSALTMLGIIIGIGSIIAIVSTIKGTNEQIKENLVGAGNNAVNIHHCIYSASCRQCARPAGAALRHKVPAPSTAAGRRHMALT